MQEKGQAMAGVFIVSLTTIIGIWTQDLGLTD
jgi:hypothetical protein